MQDSLQLEVEPLYYGDYRKKLLIGLIKQYFESAAHHSWMGASDVLSYFLSSDLLITADEAIRLLKVFELLLLDFKFKDSEYEVVKFNVGTTTEFVGNQSDFKQFYW